MTTAPTPASRSAARAAGQHESRTSPTIWRRLRPSRHHLADLAGIGTLTTIALLGFRTTYVGTGWLVAGLAGILLGLACAHVTANLRLPGIVTAVTGSAAYLLLGGPLATREALIGGVLPSGQTISSLARTAVRGWKELLTTLPPVDSSGPLAALPFLFGLAGAATAYGIARRWAGAMRALVVPIGLLLLAILLGTMTPALLLAQGAGFALVAVGYAAVRAARGRPPLQNGAGRTTRAVTTALLLALAGTGGLVLGPRLPGAADHPRTVWRTAMEPPFDLAQYPSPLAGYRRYTEPNPAALYDKTLFTVAGLPAGTPIRLATLDTYDGAVWGAGSTAGAAQVTGLPAGATTPAAQATGAAFRRVGSHIAVIPPDGATEAQAQVVIPEGGWSDVWLPTAGTPTTLEFAGPRAEALGPDLRYNTETATGILPARLLPGDSYRLTTYLLPSTELPGQLALATGSSVDTSALAFLDGKIDQWSGRESDPWRRLLAVAAVFRGTGAYTDGGAPGDYQNVFLPGHSLARVTRFVKSAQLAGNDEQYAATLALVAARIGIPARVVLGAVAQPGAEPMTVKGSDVRAWVEVRRADGGWQTIPPQVLVPDRSKKPNQQQDSTDQKQTGAVVPPPAANNPPSILQGPDQAQNAAPNRSQGAKRSFLDPATWPAWLRILVLYAAPPLLAVALVLLGIAALKARRRRRRRRAAGTARQVEGGWAELVDTAVDLGIPLPRNATRVELGRVLPASAKDLAQTADAHVFGAGDPSPEQSAAYWRGVGSAVRDLRSAVSRRQRWRARVSTRSLRGPRYGATGTPATRQTPSPQTRRPRLLRSSRGERS